MSTRSRFSSKIKFCRVCFNSSLVEVYNLGKFSISNFTDEPTDSPKLPMVLVYCDNCCLLQLAHNFNRDLLYKNYWYKSGLNKEIVEDLKSIAKEVKGDRHIDIGSNDGTLLKYSPAKDKIGVDPSMKTGYGKWIEAYFEDVTTTGFSPLNADTITAVACLYDLPDPNKFMENVKRHLTEDGIFIAQLMTLQPMLDNNDIGNVCHEHLEYYSYKSLKILYEQNGLEIYRIEENKMNGGSYRIFARHYRKGSIDYNEPEINYLVLQRFIARCLENRDKFLEFRNGKNIVGYGASTKAGSIMQFYDWCPWDVVDINPDKVGKYMVMGAKVVDKIPKDTDYLWAFPYGFIDYFKAKEKDYSGKWITTMPEFSVS